jgi:HTH-type transcriptional regulator / antitoxin HigA
MEMIAARMDRNKYGRLLLRVTPTAIESEAENERVLSVIEELMAKGEAKLSPEEDALIELLTQLVENFEKRAYPRQKSDPAQLVRFLLDQRGLKPVDLAPVVGSRGRVSDILSGRRSISKEQAKRLGEFFHVSPALFI